MRRFEQILSISREITRPELDQRAFEPWIQNTIEQPALEISDIEKTRGGLIGYISGHKIFVPQSHTDEFYMTRSQAYIFIIGRARSSYIGSMRAIADSRFAWFLENIEPEEFMDYDLGVGQCTGVIHSSKTCGAFFDIWADLGLRHCVLVPIKEQLLNEPGSISILDIRPGDQYHLRGLSLSGTIPPTIRGLNSQRALRRLTRKAEARIDI